MRILHTIYHNYKKLPVKKQNIVSVSAAIAIIAGMNVFERIIEKRSPKASEKDILKDFKDIKEHDLFEGLHLNNDTVSKADTNNAKKSDSSNFWDNIVQTKEYKLDDLRLNTGLNKSSDSGEHKADTAVFYTNI